eukprot:tig00000532_g1883.t1
MKFSNGDVYQGPWREGAMDGAGGTMTYWDGRVYTGDWRRNVRHGRGVMLYTNGDKYEGEWNQGVRQGRYPAIPYYAEVDLRALSIRKLLEACGAGAPR